LVLAEPRGMRPLVAHCHSARCITARAIPGQAQEHLIIATTMYREMGMIYWLEHVTAEARQLE